MNVVAVTSAFWSKSSESNESVCSVLCASDVSESSSRRKAGCNGLVTHPASSITICEVVPKVLPNPIVKSSAESSMPICQSCALPSNIIFLSSAAAFPTCINPALLSACFTP